MGGGYYSQDDYSTRQTLRAKTNTPTFAYTSKMNSAPVRDRKTHPDMDPLEMRKNGKLDREARDSVDHPTSIPIAVPFDVTGSMGQVPEIVQGKLNSLMTLLLKKGYVDHPQIMAGAIGDSYTDQAPIQVGQFESSIAIEDHLTNIYIEGGGGGQVHESYGLFLYYLARHTSTDAWEKRKKKGYIFITGDEKSHPITKDHVKKWIGDDIEENLSFEQILKEVQEKWEVFFILPNMTSYYNDPGVNDFWKNHLGEKFLKLDDPNGVAELIATTIGLMEGRADTNQIEDDLADVGVDSRTANAITKSLSKLSAGGTLIKGKPLAGTGLSTL